MSEKHYAMVINTTRCFGCQTCVVICKVNNLIPGDAYWSHVQSLDGEITYQATGTFPNVRMSFRPTLCNHCENPACLGVCPAGAIAKDSETGIVSIDAQVCIGCQACASACPYGAPAFDETASVMQKCTFCAPRVAEGLEPFCVEACPGRARVFGDLNDPESDVSKLMASGVPEPWKPEAGTSPNVFYITTRQ